MFVGVGGGGGGGGVNAFCVCMELGDWASEKLSGRVQLEGHSPKWRVVRNFSFQPCDLSDNKSKQRELKNCLRLLRLINSVDFKPN